MTNKEVLEGLLAGKVYKIGKTRYKIDNNGELRQSVMNTEWILVEDISFNNIQGFELCLEPSPEKQTWWKHEFAVGDEHDLQKEIRYTLLDWNDYNKGWSSNTYVCNIKSIFCYASSFKEAVKILEGDK